MKMSRKPTDKLTDKMEAFCQSYVKNGCQRPIYAYMDAYEKDYVYAKAKCYELLKKEKIKNRIDELVEIKKASYKCLCEEDIIDKLSDLAVNGSSEKIQLEAIRQLRECYGMKQETRKVEADIQGNINNNINLEQKLEELTVEELIKLVQEE